MTQPQTAPQTPPATPQTPPATPQTPPATPQAAVKPEPVKFAFPFPGLNTLEGKPTEVPANIYIKTWGQYAMDGFYPIGLSGQWHGGIHFDDNTGTQFNQTLGVRCLADGEVIAWRYDEQPQVSEYDEGRGKYSTGFVLVRHRLQYPEKLMPPAGGQPPECLIYSLYMHLLHPSAYVPNPDALEGTPPVPARPDIWVNETDRLRRVVGKKARDKRPAWSLPASVSTQDRGKLLNEVGVNLSQQGRTVAWAGPGARLTLKPGEGGRRELLVVENQESWFADPAAGVQAPVGLQVWDSELDKVPGLPQTGAVHILPEPLPVKAGALIGHPGDYQRFGEVCIHNNKRRILHLEVFAGPEFKGFIEQCRNLDARVPDSDKRLLVLEEGALPGPWPRATLTIPAGEWLRLDAASPKEGYWVLAQRGTNSYSGTDVKQLKAGFTPHTPSLSAWVGRDSFERAAQNGLVRLDSAWTEAWEIFPLRACNDTGGPPVAVSSVIDLAHKEVPLVSARLVKFADDEQGHRWWLVRYFAYLKDRLVGVQGWVSKETEKVKLCTQWAWPGFDLIEEDPNSPLDFHNLRKLNRYEANSPLLEKLLALIDTNGDGKLSLTELHDGWEKSWLAQPLSRLVIAHKSEWGLEMRFWDEVGEAIKAAAKRPENQDLFDFAKIWNEERKRIEKLRFWDEVKRARGFPQDIKVWHVHPLGLVENFVVQADKALICKDCGATITLTEEFLKHADVAPNASQAFIDELIKCSTELFPKYAINTCNQITHLLAQAKVETKLFTAFRERLYYSRALYGNGGLYPVGTKVRLYDMAPTAINEGFSRKGITFTSIHNKYVWCDTHLIENDTAYGEHCFGSNLHPGKDYRGRGLLHLTKFDHYEKAAQGTGFPVDSQPELVESDMRVIIETGLWFWNWKSLPNIGKIQDIANNPSNPANAGNAGVRLITKLVTGSFTQALGDRQLYKRQISPLFNEMFNGCADVTDV